MRKGPKALGTCLVLHCPAGRPPAAALLSERWVPPGVSQGALSGPRGPR